MNLEFCIWTLQFFCFLKRPIDFFLSHIVLVSSSNELRRHGVFSHVKDRRTSLFLTGLGTTLCSRCGSSTSPVMVLIADNEELKSEASALSPEGTEPFTVATDRHECMKAELGALLICLSETSRTGQHIALGHSLSCIPRLLKINYLRNIRHYMLI